jgi:hypothetical protein
VAEGCRKLKSEQLNVGTCNLKKKGQVKNAYKILAGETSEE